MASSCNLERSGILASISFPPGEYGPPAQARPSLSSFSTPASRLVRASKLAAASVWLNRFLALEPSRSVGLAVPSDPILIAMTLEKKPRSVWLALSSCTPPRVFEMVEGGRSRRRPMGVGSVFPLGNYDWSARDSQHAARQERTRVVIRTIKNVPSKTSCCPCAGQRLEPYESQLNRKTRLSLAVEVGLWWAGVGVGWRLPTAQARLGGTRDQEDFNWDGGNGAGLNGKSRGNAAVWKSKEKLEPRILKPSKFNWLCIPTPHVRARPPAPHTSTNNNSSSHPQNTFFHALYHKTAHFFQAQSVLGAYAVMS